MMFQDQVIIVSGVGPGLGQALVAGLIHEGASVVLAARNEQKLADVAALYPGDRTLCVPTDISREEDCRNLAKRVQERFGRVDALINNAFDVGPMGLIADASFDEAWSRPFEINVKGSLRMVQALLPALRGSQGAVVMVNSVSARSCRPGFASYAISKGGLQTASRMLAAELAADRIRVNTVFPGYIDGPPLRAAFEQMAAAEGVTAKEVGDRIAASLPLGFIPTSEDVAEAALFLASRRARGITGASLDVNSGEFSPL